MVQIAEVVTLYESNRLDVPATMRLIADQIEAGNYGDVSEASIVIMGDTLEVFGLGETDGASCHLLHGCAARKLENMVLDSAT